MKWEPETTEVEGIKLEVRRHGKGPPVIVLHGDEACRDVPPFDLLLAESFEVIVPSLPGLNGSELPNWVEDVNDLAYVMLDFVAQLERGGVNLVGHGFGGWVAAEMAVRSIADLHRLVLIDSFGIKTSGAAVRDIQDLYVLPAGEVATIAWHDPARAAILKWPGAAGVSDEDLVVLLQNRQAVLGFGWSPYMYNPKLLRILHRVKLPTQVIWGESDRVVHPEYGRAFQRAIPGARFELIPRAGHFPHWEQPEALAEVVTSFLTGC